MDRGPQQTSLQRRHKNIQQTYEKMLNITNYQGKANENHTDLNTGQNGYGENEHKYRVLVRMWRTESPGKLGQPL